MTGAGDVPDTAVEDEAAFADINLKASRSGADHFRVVSVLGSGEFGYVFKVRRDAVRCMESGASSRIHGLRDRVLGALYASATPKSAQALRTEARRTV
jgi:hypothetical protein